MVQFLTLLIYRYRFLRYFSVNLDFINTASEREIQKTGKYRLKTGKYISGHLKLRLLYKDNSDSGSDSGCLVDCLLAYCGMERYGFRFGRLACLLACLLTYLLGWIWNAVAQDYYTSSSPSEDSSHPRDTAFLERYLLRYLLILVYFGRLAKIRAL